jgi:hypothetical protein
MSARDGKRWNNERREWVVENLEDEAASLPADDEDILSAARERTRCSEGALRQRSAHAMAASSF